MPVLPVFLALLITFHCSEFILACVYQRKELSFSCESAMARMPVHVVEAEAQSVLVACLNSFVSLRSRAHLASPRDPTCVQRRC